MIGRTIIAILMSPVWLLLSILITVMYAIGYIKGSENITNFYDIKEHSKESPMYNEANEFDIHAN